MSGQVGISRVKAGDIFFGPFFVVTLMHQFFRFWSLFPVLASSLRLTQTPDSLRSPGGWGAECRVWTVNVGSGRSKSIQVDPGRVVFFFWRLCGWVCGRLGIGLLWRCWAVLGWMDVVLGVVYHGFGGFWGEIGDS